MRKSDEKNYLVNLNAWKKKDGKKQWIAHKLIDGETMCGWKVTRDAVYSYKLLPSHILCGQCERQLTKMMEG